MSAPPHLDSSAGIADLSGACECNLEVVQKAHLCADISRWSTRHRFGSPLVRAGCASKSKNSNHDPATAAWRILCRVSLCSQLTILMRCVDCKDHWCGLPHSYNERSTLDALITAVGYERACTAAKEPDLLSKHSAGH